MSERKYLSKTKLEHYKLFKRDDTSEENFIKLLESIYDDGVLDGKLQAYDEIRKKFFSTDNEEQVQQNG